MCDHHSAAATASTAARTTVKVTATSEAFFALSHDHVFLVSLPLHMLRLEVCYYPVFRFRVCFGRYVKASLHYMAR